MPIEITMPKLTDTMSEATLAKWLKKEGDKINPGDMIAEVETDKATQELETFEAGTIAKIVAPAGSKMPVGAVIVVIAKPGEDAKAIAANFKGGSAPAAKAAPAAQTQSVAVENASDSAKVLTATGTVVLPDPTEGGAEEGHEQIVAPANGKQRVSPLARRLADEHKIDLAYVTGTGPDGRVIKRDVLAAAAANASTASKAPTATNSTVKATGPSTAAAPAIAPPAAKLESKKIPLTNIRQTIAKRLAMSKQTIPHFYVSIDVVMDNLLALRSQANEQIKPEKLSVTDFIARAVAVVLAKLPAMNASFTDTEIIQHGSVDLGIAVAIEDGLVVPVLRQAHTKGIRAISAEIKSLAELARTKKLKAQDMVGSTFTISNLGMYGIKEFSAIINPPESAILAVGGTEERPIVRDKQIVIGQVMTLTLSADHRVVDGALGAQFLAELKKTLENPLTMLV